MRALLLVAHGSRRKTSNDEVLLLADRLKEVCSEKYPIVHAAFLELAEPLIPEGIRQCLHDGATTVVVLPYFLNSGRHVSEDIPHIVSQARTTHPGVELHIAAHLGASDLIMNLLISSANSAASR